MSSTDLKDTRSHVPVMVTEVLDGLSIQSTGIYLDGTVGLAGHATAIHSLLSQQGKLFGFDLDEEALKIARTKLSASSPPVSLHHASYSDFPHILRTQEITQVNGILLDLGVSSLQLNAPERGFSFQNDGPLDMRFDKSSGRPASDLIRATSESELADLIYKYGEERRSRSIARALKKTPMPATISAAHEAIRRVTPPAHRNRSLARVFQALRIAVNDELEKLAVFLDCFADWLTIGGRVVIISYHSLEDRLVKQAFRRLANEGAYKILTKKPLRPSEGEVETNRRAKAAKLRVAERIA